MCNTTAPMDDSDDDSFSDFDASDSFYEHLFEGLDSIPTDPMLDEPWVDPYLQGGHHEADEYMEGESW